MATFGPNQLEAGLAAWAAENEAKATLVIKKIIVDIFTQAVQRTPVDTGLLQSSWNIGIDEESKRQGEKKSDTNLQLSKIRVPRIGPVYVISNPLEYAEYVEEGTSRNRPRKMLRSSVDDTVAALEGAF